MTKYIVVAGGVMSGVGKGVTTSSLGKILLEHGYKVTAIKIDPYINYDAGTLRPTEHGEVWITDDGGEIDQDLGNYERFFGVDIPKKNNITTGQIYKTLIDKERNGEFLGETVQFIPHVPEEIKRRIKLASEGYDFALIEIGGTIGDYENVPFLFAMKSLERELGENSVAYVLITYLPTPSHIDEMKTKPTQQAIRMLSEHGIFPDFIICRAKKPLDEVRKKKIETYVNIPIEHIISEPDIDTIYQIPIDLEKENLGQKILSHFKMKTSKKPDWSKWESMVKIIRNPEKRLSVAIIGKYVKTGDYQLADSYISINHALAHAGMKNKAGINIEWLDSNLLEKRSGEELLKKYDGIIIPGGFGSKGVEGKINAITYARTNNIPFLGLCFGLQLAVIEYARNVCNLSRANTTEIDEKTPYPVVDILPSQKEIIQKHEYGATMRLGEYAAILKEGSKVLGLYKKTSRIKEDVKRLHVLKTRQNEKFRLGILGKEKHIILERHRHRYEINPDYIEALEKNDLVFSGWHIKEDKAMLMEFLEINGHKFFIATQSHPEFKSRIEDPSPLFLGFVEAMCE